MPNKPAIFFAACALAAPIAAPQSVNSPGASNAAAKDPVAIVDGQPITDEEPLPYVQSQLRPISSQHGAVRALMPSEELAGPPGVQL